VTCSFIKLLAGHSYALLVHKYVTLHEQIAPLMYQHKLYCFVVAVLFWHDVIVVDLFII